MEKTTKKITIFFVLSLFALHPPLHAANTTQPPFNPYKILFSISIIFFGIGGLATIYCHSQEQQLTQKLNLIFEGLELGEEDRRRLEDELRQRISPFTRSKYIFGVATAVSFAGAIVSGILLYGQGPPGRQTPSKPTQQKPQLTQQEIEAITKKLLLAQALEKSVHSLDHYLVHAKDFDSHLKASKTKLFGCKAAIEKDKKELEEKQGGKLNKKQKKIYNNNKRRISLALQRIAVDENNSVLKKEELKGKFDKFFEFLDDYEKLFIDPSFLPTKKRKLFELHDQTIANFLEDKKQDFCDYLKDKPS